ncbi:hypothetical protein NG895_29190 [Aeoliella sp. ICT_H6.2]|uniref:Uncharacterized protein n=1 Tax=Aeoliella straminimaris TaxID=2954799 RepID=A0A9X2JJT2_9BACT|nr:hypothetical protein [Aeoliella straminimaris]MCO6047997.1 hypothetical protein [Aeoliella straminimaris]
MERLQESQRFCIWLDRRVDPSSEVNLSVKNTPLSELLDTLANQGDAAWVADDTLIYVGPPANVREFRTLLAIAREQAAELPSAASRRMLAKVTMEIPRLAEPRRLVEQLGQRGGVRIENLDKVPHDVWPASQLTALSVADQLTTVLSGFDLRWEPTSNGRAIRIAPIERPVVWRRLYDRTVLEEPAAANLQPDAIADSSQKSQVWIATTVEQHEALGGVKPAATTARSRPQTRPRRGDKQVYSLRVQQQPIGPMLTQLARQLGKQLQVDPQVDEQTLNQRVSFEVKQADLDELLQAACNAAGLAARVEGDTIHLELDGAE